MVFFFLIWRGPRAIMPVNQKHPEEVKMKNLFLSVFFAAAWLFAGSFAAAFEGRDSALSQFQIQAAGQALEKAYASKDDVCMSAVLSQIEEGAEIDSSCLTADQKGLLLLLASRREDAESVRRHIALGANVNTQDELGRTPLGGAAERGQTEIMGILLANGADPNIRGAFKFGGTALHGAAEKGQTEAAETLLAAGADPNIRDLWGKTALHKAAEMGRTEIAALLLESGADPNIRDGGGETALHEAAEGGRTEIAALLLESGADPDIQDGGGETALHEAAESGRTEIAALLLENNADIEIKHKGRPYSPLLRPDKLKWERFTTAFDVAIKMDNRDIALILAERTENLITRAWRKSLLIIY